MLAGSPAENPSSDGQIQAALSANGTEGQSYSILGVTFTVPISDQTEENERVFADGVEHQLSFTVNEQWNTVKVYRFDDPGTYDSSLTFYRDAGMNPVEKSLNGTELFSFRSGDPTGQQTYWFFARSGGYCYRITYELYDGAEELIPAFEASLRFAEEEQAKLPVEETAPANTTGDLLVENDTLTVCYIEKLQDTSLKSIPDGVASIRVSIANNSGEELWIKAAEPSINGDSAHLTASIQNAEGLWDSNGLILAPGQEAQICVGITKLGASVQPTATDLQNVDFVFYVKGDGDWVTFPVHVN